MSRVLWSAALAAAMYGPARTLSFIDGLPLDRVAEAIVLGVVLPFLWVLRPQVLDRRWTRIAILVLLASKIAGWALLAQEGLCARFSSTAPLRKTVLTIPIEEPHGTLRSWDVRADWRAPSPSCTAIIDRSYPTASAFPVWFLNLTDFVVGPDGPHREEAVPRNIALEVTGSLMTEADGRLAIEVGDQMALAGRIGSEEVVSHGGAPVDVSLGAGVHSVALHLVLTGNRWKFLPRWNGQDAFRAVGMTVRPPRRADTWLGAPLRLAVRVATAALLVGWAASALVEYSASPMLLAWITTSALLLATFAGGRFERLSVLLLVGGALVPIAAVHRTWRSALLLLGVPWLSFFVARSLAQIGQVSEYSVDDWLAYQAAGYRIFMGGFWLEGGSRLFDYQPLYRWISGTLHLVFGDSSVGEVYWDVACLLAGALVTFALVKPLAGFAWGIGAAALTLATFALGTTWYFVGRGLSEIAAAGFAFFAALSLVSPRGSRPLRAAGAGALAALMFYTRLNHLIFSVLLSTLLLPLEVPAGWRSVGQALRRIEWASAFAYGATLAAGVALFALRTWWYTGVFSVLYGTSLRNNDTGLRVATVGSLEVWRRIAHSLAALVWMNEPPTPDPRALIVVTGAALSVLALIQVPRFNRLPFSIAVVTVGTGVSSLFAHTHNYPGRMSIHLVPFAVAIAAIAAAWAVRSWRGERSRSALPREVPA